MSEDKETHRLLGKIEATLERVLLALEKQEIAHEKIEERVSSIENRLSWAAGVAVVVMFVFTAVIDWAKKKLGLI